MHERVDDALRVVCSSGHIVYDITYIKDMLSEFQAIYYSLRADR